MTPAASDKVCVHCGEDCSYKPRVKDSHENYYCKTCHEKVEKNLRKRKEIIHSPVPQEIIATADSEADIPMVDAPQDHDHDHGDLLSSPGDSGSSEYEAIMEEVIIKPAEDDPVEPDDPDDLLLLEDDDD